VKTIRTTDKLLEMLDDDDKIEVGELLINSPVTESYDFIAGIYRTKATALYADVLAAFWDRERKKGTKNMIETMRKLNKEVLIYSYK
jgi:hypothetical protein